MNSLAEKEFKHLRKNRRLFLVSEKKEREENISLYYNSGVFPIFIIMLLLLCVVLLLHVGLRLQSASYNKQVFEYERIISLEQDRTDRLNLKIAELRSPNRVLANLEGEQLDVSNMNFKKININSGILNNNEQLKYFSEKDDEFELRKYKGLANTLGNMREIIMVVSESVLTFFIP
jgi:cell division protein FtsL